MLEIAARQRFCLISDLLSFHLFAHHPLHEYLDSCQHERVAFFSKSLCLRDIM